MASKLSTNDLRLLHGEDYVRKFCSNQNAFRLKRLLPYFTLNPSDHVVDFACGNAMLMPLVAPLVKSYVGVDFSSSFIDAAKNYAQQTEIENISFYCEDIKLFCKDKHKEFDVAFAMDFSEHVYDDDWLEILKSVHSTLKPNARFYLHTPNGDYVVERLKNLGILRQLPEHIAVRNTNENIKLLQQAGFNDISTIFLPHYEQRQAWLHTFSNIPLVGSLFRARLFIACKA